MQRTLTHTHHTHLVALIVHSLALVWHVGVEIRAHHHHIIIIITKLMLIRVSHIQTLLSSYDNNIFVYTHISAVVSFHGIRRERCAWHRFAANSSHTSQWVTKWVTHDQCPDTDIDESVSLFFFFYHSIVEHVYVVCMLYLLCLFISNIRSNVPKSGDRKIAWRRTRNDSNILRE